MWNFVFWLLVIAALGLGSSTLFVVSLFLWLALLGK